MQLNQSKLSQYHNYCNRNTKQTYYCCNKITGIEEHPLLIYAIYKSLFKLALQQKLTVCLNNKSTNANLQD